MHLHLFAAIAWIGGAIFMFVLGITLRDKQKQQNVYPNIGPIFGYYQLASLILLVTTGFLLISNNGLLEQITNNDASQVVTFLRAKLSIVALVVVATVIHFYIAMKTNNKQRTNLENFISRGSSLFIFFANLFILHYAIMIRSIL
jgi:putative copper export protein